MKRLIVTAIVLAATIGAWAQIARVSAPEAILADRCGTTYNPILSPDGMQLLFSGADYSHLSLYDFATGEVSEVCADPREGFNTGFNAAGRVARRAVSERCLPEIDAPAYLWVSASPDNTKTVFVAAGRGVYVASAAGEVLAFLGKYEAPVWLGNDVIVAQESTDDGHQFHSSRIVLLRADGSEIQPITAPESMTFSPAASLAAGRIVYATVDGRLFQVNVTLTDPATK